MTDPSGAPDRQAALAAVRVPAWGLVASGVLGFVWVGFNFLFKQRSNEFFVELIRKSDPKAAEQFANQLANPSTGEVVMNVASIVVWLIASTLILTGGLRMKDLRSWGLALTGAILSTICICGGCCCIGLPFGIWAIVVLCRAEVKAAFR